MNSAYCRLCLKSDCWNSPIPIFENSTLPCKLNDLLQMQLNPLDSLPKVICHLCLAKVTFLVEFQKQVNTSNNLLNSLVGERGAISAADSQKDDGVSSIPVSKSSLSTLSTPKAKVIPQQIAEIKPATATVNDAKFQSHSNIQKQKSVRKKRIQRPSINEMNVKLFNCTRCRYRTRNAELFEAHKKKKFECPICHLLFCSLKGMGIHKSRHKVNDKFSMNTEETFNDAINNGKKHGDDDIDHPDNDNDAGDSENNDDCENNYGGKDDHEDHKSGNKTDPMYLWCRSCNKVYVNEADFVKHNEEYHNFPSKNDTDEGAVTEGNSHLRSLSERNSLALNETPNEVSGSVEPSQSLPKKRGRPFGSKKKDSSTSESEDVSSKRVKKNCDFTCWKCKGVFTSRAELFIHPCILPTDLQSSSKSTDRKNSVDSAFVASGDLEVVDHGSKKKQVPQVISDEEDYDINDQEFDDQDEIQFIKDRLSSKKDNLTNTHTIYTTDESDHDPENCNENADGKTDVSDHESDGNDVGSVEEERVIPLSDGDEPSDSSLPSKSPEPSTPVNKLPESPNKSGSLKRCNECGEMFHSMKALFHHKRLHKTEVSEL